METRKPKKLFILGEGLQNFFSIPSQKSLIGHFVVHSKSTEEKHRRVNLQFLQTESNVIEQLNLEFDESEEPDESVKIFELKVAKHGHEKFARKVIHDSENDDINGTNDKTPIPKSSGAFENSATIGKNPKLPLVNFIRTVKDAIKEGESANNNIRKEMELLHSIIDQISRKTPEKRNKSVSEIMRSYEKSRNSTLLHGIIVPDHSKSQYP